MDLLKDMKFQLAIIALVTAGIKFFVPDIDEDALISVVTTLVAIVLGGHGIASVRKK